jgi:hypothetical protein
MLTGTVLPYGLRDVRLVPLDANNVEGTPVDLPIAQTFTFSESEEYEELRGDDRVVAIVGKGPVVDWSIEAGGITLEAWMILSGGTLVNAGATPNQTKEFTKKVTDRRPYFKVIGQSVADGGGDTWITIFRCKTDGNVEGEWSDGTFFVTKCSGKGLGDEDENLYRITWHETQLPIPEGAANEIQQITVDATGGTFTITYSGQTTTAIAYNATPTVVRTALEALSNIAPGEVVVTGADGGPWTVEFAGTLGGINVAKMTTTGTSLTGGGGAVVTVVQNGG